MWQNGKKRLIYLGFPNYCCSPGLLRGNVCWSVGQYISFFITIKGNRSREWNQSAIKRRWGREIMILCKPIVQGIVKICIFPPTTLLMLSHGFISTQLLYLPGFFRLTFPSGRSDGRQNAHINIIIRCCYCYYWYSYNRKVVRRLTTRLYKMQTWLRRGTICKNMHSNSSPIIIMIWF